LPFEPKSSAGDHEVLELNDASPIAWKPRPLVRPEFENADKLSDEQRRELARKSGAEWVAAQPPMPARHRPYARALLLDCRRHTRPRRTPTARPASARRTGYRRSARSTTRQTRAGPDADGDPHPAGDPLAPHAGRQIGEAA
jgi:hypothetical protein